MGAREVAESVPECHKALKRMPEFKQGDKRLERLRKFMKSQKRKRAKLKMRPKLSFEICIDEDDEVTSHPAIKLDSKKRLTKSKNIKEIESSKQTKKVIPKKFIAHI